MAKIKEYLTLYLAFCFLGAGFEWLYGFFWDTAGTSPWLYPTSFLRYTSLEAMPLWGFGGLIGICFYKAITGKSANLLFPALPCLMLGAALWIRLYTIIF